MDSIRFVGRARGGRCVFCHDGLDGSVARCEDCRAAWHDECLAGGRCPTLGCAAWAPAPVQPPPAARAETTLVTPTPAPPTGAQPRERQREPRWVHRRGERAPRLLARLGPYSRLIWSGVAHLALLGASLGWVAALLLHPAARGALTEAWSEGAGRLLLSLAVGALNVVVALRLARHAARWLLRLPGIVRELGELLDRTTPTLMDLEVLIAPDARGVGRWCARLTGRPGGPEAGRRYDLAVNPLLTPWWVTLWGRRSPRPVLVYGLPPPGPYVIEFEGGALALVHHDESAPELREVREPAAPERGRRRRKRKKRRR